MTKIPVSIMRYSDTHKVGYALDGNKKSIAIYRVYKRKNGFFIDTVYTSPDLDKEQRIELLNEMNMLVINYGGG